MRKPLTIPFQDTSYWAHHQKAVEAERLLDDMGDFSTWGLRETAIPGAAVYGTIAQAERDGVRVMRLESPTVSRNEASEHGRGWGATTLLRAFPAEDWSEYNRIAFDVYPDLPGFRVVSLCVLLYTDDGEESLPRDNVREGLHFIILQNHAWNHCYWEIPELKRERVTGLGLQYRLQSNEPGATEEVCYDFSNLRLQKVDADHTRGWLPKSGQISFSHVGYTPDSQKTAVAVGLGADRFELVCAESGQVVFRGPVKTLQAHTGEYQVLDFTEVAEEGRYFLKAGESLTRPFRIARDVWKSTIVKDVNSFFALRCGYLVPGVHDICHADLRARHGELTKVMNGGWHDAGDLSQGLVNSSETALGMMALALRVKQSDPDLYELLMEEARWGQDWVLKTRFTDGYRISWLTMDFWSDGVEGNLDDVTFDAKRTAYDNFLPAANEALAARAFAEEDPPFALRNRKAAEEDFAWGDEDWRADLPAEEKEKRLGGNEVGVASQAALAAVELYWATGKQAYLDKAAEYGRVVLGCQQTEWPQGWETPVRGFFYTDRTHRRILHFPHRSHEQAPLVALSKLYEALPGHEDAPKWKMALELYAEYVKFTTRFTQPWGMLPASIYSLDEVGDNVRGRGSLGCPADAAKEQIESGIRLSDKHYLRLFPVWYTFRGNCGTTLSACRGALACAEALKDRELVEICRRQLEWTVGRNPFNQSLIWGEGYNFTPQYSATSGDIVGTFPVGVETQGNEDVPYYPDANCYNYKEVWVQPAARWYWLMERLYRLDF